MINLLRSEFAPSSLVYYEQAPLEAQSLLRDAHSFSLKRDWSEAERCALGAQDICRKAVTYAGSAVAQVHLAEIYGQVGELGKAMEQCKIAYQVLNSQPARIQRHNEAVAAYAMAILYELHILGSGAQTLHWYEKALCQFKTAQEYWASVNDMSQHRICKVIHQWIEKRKRQIANFETRKQAKLPTFNVRQLDSEGTPFAKEDSFQGYIVDSNHVWIDGTTYYLHAGRLPERGNGERYYYFALRVPEDHWAVSEAQAGDYVLIRQQWWVNGEQLAEQGRPGVVWEPGSGWLEVNFKRGRDGKVRFHHPHPRIIGSLTPPGDPAGRVKGYISALLKPEYKAIDFAGAVIEGLGTDSTLVLNKKYKLRAGFPAKNLSDNQHLHRLLDSRPLEVDITIHAPGMEILPGKNRKLLFTGPNSDLVEFTLIPRKIPDAEIPGEKGRTQIEIDFYQQQHWLAKLQFPVKVISTATEKLLDDTARAYKASVVS
jgi:tetratricopeptide (TPR) repeat protein